jgi:beta-ribofuranosylaminobenzene 5'-phosphate synthase
MIEVRTCARLHLGLLDNNGGHGRLYGSIGLAINQPQLVLKAEHLESLVVEGLETERVTAYAERFIRRYGVPAGACLNLSTGIPAHVGLGSGTQIALAVGTALARLGGLHLSAEEIALATGRGLRSGIGIATFQHGGFVLDGGHRISSSPANDSQEIKDRQPEKNRVPPILFHHPVPKDWYFVTVIPGTGQGISGERENSVFSHLPGAAPELAEKVSRLLLMKMLPALVEKDIVSFGQALTGIQQIVGDCFAVVQGGRYSNPLSEKLIEFLLKSGAVGAGQSSWGPAVYGLIEGQAFARKLTNDVQAFLDTLGTGKVLCVQPRNRGAQVREVNVVAPQDACASN